MKTILTSTCALVAALTLSNCSGPTGPSTQRGAVTGALVGGPVGAVVGGVLGVTAGAHINPPPREVVTYVEEQPVPQQRIVVQEQVVVGEALPEDVVVEQVPESDGYAYAFVNDQRVIVEPDTRRIVKIIQ